MNTFIEHSSSEKSSTKTNRKKSAQPRQNRRTWKQEEVEKILNYLRETILNGQEIERPNAPSYYKTMLEKIKLDDCNEKSIINKMSSHKKSYDDAINWREKTGQGVEDTSTVREYILKLCKHFDDLHEIFGARVSSVNPYESESLCIGHLRNSDYSQHEVITSEMVETEQHVCAGANELWSPNPAVEVTDQPNMINEKSIAKKRKKEPTEFGLIVSKRQAIQMEELSIAKERMQFEKQKLSFERELQMESLNLEKEKFKLQEKSMDAELELKRYQLEFEKAKFELQNQNEMEKFRIEQQFKFELELAKMKGPEHKT